jgi:hypothetical protein
VKLSGGTAYNRYDTENPILGETPALQALGRLRNAQIDTEGTKQQANQARAGYFDSRAADVDVRRQIIEEATRNPDADPLLKLDAANKKPTFKSEKIKVKRADGSTVYMDRTPNLTGGFDYAPARDAAGQDLIVPPAERAPERSTATAKDAQLIAETYGIPYEQALEIKLMDGPQRSRALRKLKETQARTGAGGGSAKADPKTDAVYQQARQAIAAGAKAEAVKARLKSMGLDPGRL